MADEIIRLSRAQVREYDRLAIKEYGIPGIVLMETAARGVADAAIRCFHPRSVLILCGNGNNGGDGFAMAPMLMDAGIAVKILRVDPASTYSPDAAHFHELIWDRNVPLTDAVDRDVDLIVDAIFGTGLNRPPSPLHARVIESANQTGVPILAVDVPSGLDCDTGEPLGACIRATRTVTFVAEKLGFANPNSRAFTGIIEVIGIGVPDELLERARSRS